MKPSIVTLAVLGIAVSAGTLFYWHRQNAVPKSTPVIESSSDLADQTPADQPIIRQPEMPRRVSAAANETATVVNPNPVLNATQPDRATNALTQMVDALTSTQTSFGEKQSLWNKLKAAGEMDQVIAELKLRATNNPNDPEIPATLGQAELHKADALSKNGGSINEMGILGMQADQHFDAALKLDPANWEAQFFKAAAMSYWPAELKKGPEVVQRFSALIDQQETLAAQAQFAQAYLLLGNQYQKMNQADKAAATWQLGLEKFPNDPTLQEKISGQ